MSYSIVVPKSVQKQLDRLPEQVYQRILKKIRLLAEEPRPAGSIKLKGVEAEYRFRIGDYRLRYKIDDDNRVIILGRCQHRKNVYD
ncbi:type II toxin-antitoxin system RelE/ParE family toxin [Nodosilinea sp. LEGE 07088]|uniref:type II toxin-antitoxin system RelE family toxin n=1 Tax=Nodosilinea sp. LEGE 07088 TaxID=2777968 RepID=UPI001881E202|nr:type II toxin-antitoxin system RelE/ParE family toxin [Nodosilinea sp. LEGE 07088]MBE9140556.1 type II toxin-antitoxin system RelE/ParE family toxin [Nodosilinea sp. LEGE 07088]